MAIAVSGANKLNHSAQAKFYSPQEEKINVLSHVAGLALSVVALILLILRAGQFDRAWLMTSSCVFGLSLIALYLASSFYHSATNPRLRTRLRTVDHAAIYVLIAGTYTPFTLITLNGQIGWTVFATVWSMAAIGIVVKLYFTGRYKILSTLMYVFMGWLMIFAIKPLVDNLPSEGLRWLFGGGIAYSVGAVVYTVKRIRFNHAIFHIFVLVGSFCHFIAVYSYVLPID